MLDETGMMKVGKDCSSEGKGKDLGDGKQRAVLRVGWRRILLEIAYL